jgi:hypothetical protein
MVHDINRAQLALDRCFEIDQNTREYRSLKRIPKVDDEWPGSKNELSRIPFDRAHVPASLCQPSVPGEIVDRNACSFGDNSTPTTARNGYSEAINNARPLPEPKSMNVYSSKSSGRRSRICLRTEELPRNIQRCTDPFLCRWQDPRQQSVREAG